MGRFYITTPIYYVNDVPHIGHAYTTTAADVAARFHRLLGEDVFFLTGTDEHGTKVEQAAAARGLTPKEHVDEVVTKFKEVAAKVGASNDFFIRTTDPEHESFVQQFVQRCYEAGDIYKSSYSGLYCPACEAYYTDENLVEGLCPDHGTPPVHMEEENYFFRLSAFQDRLVAHYKAHADFVRPKHRYNEALSFIEQGLEDISISRAQPQVGHRCSVGREPGHLRVGRRSDQLPERAALCSRRGFAGSVLAGELPRHGAGHPQVSRHHLAGIADVGRV